MSNPCDAIQMTHIDIRAMSSASSSDLTDVTIASKSRSSNVESRIQPESTRAPMIRNARKTMLRTFVFFTGTASSSASYTASGSTTTASGTTGSGTTGLGATWSGTTGSGGTGSVIGPWCHFVSRWRRHRARSPRFRRCVAGSIGKEPILAPLQTGVERADDLDRRHRLGELSERGDSAGRRRYRR